MESELARITKLKNIENWGVWKFQVRAILNANSAWGVTSGIDEKSTELDTGASEPVRTAHQKNLATWIKADAIAQKVIATTIGEQPMLHIINCTTAKEMWE